MLKLLWLVTYHLARAVVIVVVGCAALYVALWIFTYCVEGVKQGFAHG
jgi:hypothetical protein